MLSGIKDPYVFVIRDKNKEFKLDYINNNKIVKTKEKSFLIIDYQVQDNEFENYILNCKKYNIFNIHGDSMKRMMNTYEDVDTTLDIEECILVNHTIIDDYDNCRALRLVFECLSEIEIDK